MLHATASIPQPTAQAPRPLAGPSSPILGGEAWIVPFEPGGPAWVTASAPVIRVVDQRGRSARTTV